uniref:Uncharacterized protein n=1 Tax=Cannabis sativa TaxID=3483 RepID=A0A803R5K0_CANSA
MLITTSYYNLLMNLHITSPLQAFIGPLHPRNEWLLYTSTSLWLLHGLTSGPTDQHECFQRALSSLTRILGKLPRRSPILKLLQAKHA